MSLRLRIGWFEKTKEWRKSLSFGFCRHGLLVVMVSSGIVMSWRPAGADDMVRECVQVLLDSIQGDTSELFIDRNRDGSLQHLGGLPRGYVPIAPGFLESDPEQQARAFLDEHGCAFGIQSPQVAFVTVRITDNEDRSILRFSQTYGGLPVYAAELIIQINKAADIYDAGTPGIVFVASDIMYETDTFDSGETSLVPEISADDAMAQAAEAMAGDNSGSWVASETPELQILCPRVIGDGGKPALVWSTYVNNIFSDRFFVDAHSGEVLLRIPSVFTGSGSWSPSCAGMGSDAVLSGRTPMATLGDALAVAAAIAILIGIGKARPSSLTRHSRGSWNM